MKQEEYLEKLSKVCDWDWDYVKGESGSDGRAGHSEDRPKQLVIKNFKPITCPHNPDYKNCQQKVSIKDAKIGSKLLGRTVVTKCTTCGGLVTPKGRYIAKPESFNYALIIWQKDQEE